MFLSPVIFIKPIIIFFNLFSVLSTTELYWIPDYNKGTRDRTNNKMNEIADDNPI